MAESPPQAIPGPQSQTNPLTSSPSGDEALQTQAEIVAHQAVTTIEAETPSSIEAQYEPSVPSRGSTSLSSSVRDYTFENGRRYHKFREGRYLFPNDESEQDREDMKHALVVNLCGGKLHYAPLVEPKNILDVGTGTGIWAIDMGDEWPNAQVVGFDLSPIQPLWNPPNVHFMVDDAESPWLHAPNTFDYIHLRHMNTAIKNWPTLFKEAHNCLRPGAWIEIQDILYDAQCDDNTMSPSYPVGNWFKLNTEALLKLGVDLRSCIKHSQLLRDASFVNIEEKIFKIPIGTWPKNATMKTIGLYLRSVIIDGMHGMSMKPLTMGLGWTREEVEEYLKHVERSSMDVSTHAYVSFRVVYGQKAESS